MGESKERCGAATLNAPVLQATLKGRILGTAKESATDVLPADATHVLSTPTTPTVNSLKTTSSDDNDNK